VEKIESPCPACKHQDGCHRTDRFSDCPERLDYLLKSSGHEPHHRGFKPDVPGFEPADPDYIATGPKIIRPYHDRLAKQHAVDMERAFLLSDPLRPRSDHSDSTDIIDDLKEVEELAKNKQSVNKKPPKSSKKSLNKAPAKKKASMKTPETDYEDIVDIQTKTCSDCGKIFKGAEVILKNFSPHNLTEDGLFKYCKACNKIRLKKSIHKASNENCVMVDFSENMDLLDNLREMAAAAFRSPAQQLLYLISKA
jgi:hypothetical protein